MTFKQAQEFVMTFGKYKGRDLDDIASDDEGLLYLDWLAGENDLSQPIRTALYHYLADPCIKKELEDLHA